MALSIPNTGNNIATDATSIGVTLTASAGDIIVLCLSTECLSSAGGYATVSSVNDGTANNYLVRNSVSYQVTGSNSQYMYNAILWAYAAHALAASTVTIDLTGATLDDASLVAMDVTGFTGGTYPTNPWDDAASIALAWAASYNGSTNSVPTSNSLATVNANCLIFGFGGGSDPAGAGFVGDAGGTICGNSTTQADFANNQGGSNASQTRVIYDVVSSTQSGTVDFAASESSVAWAVMPDALSQTGGSSSSLPFLTINANVTVDLV